MPRGAGCLATRRPRCAHGDIPAHDDEFGGVRGDLRAGAQSPFDLCASGAGCGSGQHCSCSELDTICGSGQRQSGSEPIRDGR